MKNINDVVESLYPTPEEYSDNTKFFHWMEYACELDNIAYRAVDEQLTYIRERLTQVVSNTPEHDALTDVLSTVEAV